MEKQDKITIEIYHEDMVNMVCGLQVKHNYFSVLEKIGLGSYIGGFRDEWNWNRYAIQKLSIAELYDIYTQIKKKYKIQLTEEGRIQLPQEKQCDFAIVWDVEKLKKYYALERELYQRFCNGEISFSDYLIKSKEEKEKLINDET